MNTDIPMKERKASKAVQFIAYFIISIYPLILCQVDLGGLQLQSLLLFIAAMGALLYSILLIRKNEWSFKRTYYRVELAILLLAGYEFIRVLAKMLFSDANTAVSYDWEVLALSLAAVYLICSLNAVFDKKYFDALIFSGLIVFGFLLFHYLCGDGMDHMLAVLLKDSHTIASYTLLVCTVSLYQYCNCDDRLRSVFYAGTSVTGYLVLFLNYNMLSIWILAAVFLAFPVYFRTTAELLKRDMQLFFIYSFLLSNMSLLTNYTDLIRGVSFSLEQSIYLDLLLAAGGIVFFYFWDKIPEGMDLKRLVLRKMRRGYQFLLKAMGIVFAGILVGGEHWQELPDGMTLSVFKSFAVSLIKEIDGGKGTFYATVSEQGLLACGIMVILCSLMIARLRRNYSYDKPDTGIMILVASLLLVQLLFWKANMMTLPVYFVFLIFAFLYREERKRVKSVKIKCDQGGESK